MASQPLFSNEEWARYSRHLILPEFGLEGQKKLKSAKVLIVGAGGLGSPLLMYLAAAGVGKIGIVDFDVLDLSNLQRQVIFDIQHIGMSKAEMARKRIQGLNPNVEVQVYKEKLDSQNAMAIIADYDVVADGTDNFPTRYLVNDACVLLNRVNVYASVFRFEGQASVFNYPDIEGTRGPNYRDLFPEPPPPGMVPSCAEGGVLGVLPGIMGTMQALEVIKVITGMGETLSGRLFVFNALHFESQMLTIAKNPDNPLNGNRPTLHELIDYEIFCGIHPDNKSILQEIHPVELKKWRDENREFQLIDVREPFEYEICDIGGDKIPLHEIEKNQSKISKIKPVVFYCRSGKRSAKAIELLRQNPEHSHFFNLNGGILAWAETVDLDMPKY